MWGLACFQGLYGTRNITMADLQQLSLDGDVGPSTTLIQMEKSQQLIKSLRNLVQTSQEDES